MVNKVYLGKKDNKREVAKWRETCQVYAVPFRISRLWICVCLTGLLVEYHAKNGLKALYEFSSLKAILVVLGIGQYFKVDHRFCKTD